MSKIKSQLVGLVIVAMILALISASFVAYRQVRETANISAIEKAKSDLSIAEAYLDRSYSGPWRVEGDKLYKGDIQINENYELVDTIGKLTGDTCTIFLGDTRVSTNVLKEGKRAVGTKASEQVIQTVIQKKEPYFGEADVVGVKYETAYKPLLDENNDVIGMFYVGVSKQHVDELVRHAIQKILFVSIPIFALVILLVLWQAQILIIKPILALKEGAMALTEGDLTHDIEVKASNELGELATLFNRMAGNLREIVGQLANESIQLSNHSQELASASEEVSATIDAIASNSTEVAAITQQSAAGSRQVAVTTISTNTEAEKGNQLAQESVEKMHNLQSAVGTVAEHVKILHDRSQNINKIIEVITQIADQTNLLALNAAIESARAGEQGRGFAVVADEVRKLAEKSSDAANEIKDLINRILRRISNVLEEMEKSQDEANRVALVISTTGQSFSGISSAVHEISQSIEQIATGAEQISQSTQELAGSSEQISAMVQQITGSATAMAKMSEDLTTIVGKFKI